MEDLYLPPRSRKTLQQINQSEGTHMNICNFFFIKLKCTTIACLQLGRSKKRKKDDSEEGESGSEAEGSDDARPKKRGRPRVTPRENIKSFTDVEV